MNPAEGFLGTGWAFPPRFSAGGAEVAMVSDEIDIEQSLAILLATRCGERVLQDDYGCELDEFLFGEISAGLVGQVQDLVANAVLQHEPRIVLQGVEVSDERAGDGVLTLRIEYSVRGTNHRYNMVYPLYLREATGVPPAQKGVGA